MPLYANSKAKQKPMKSMKVDEVVTKFARGAPKEQEPKMHPA